jgi:hypothetical protein
VEKHLRHPCKQRLHDCNCNSGRNDSACIRPIGVSVYVFYLYRLTFRNSAVGMHSEWDTNGHTKTTQGQPDRTGTSSLQLTCGFRRRNFPLLELWPGSGPLPTAMPGRYKLSFAETTLIWVPLCMELLILQCGRHCAGKNPCVLKGLEELYKELYMQAGKVRKMYLLQFHIHSLNAGS